MLQFETLLLRQLQKQQNRDEFCDTVLHTHGVSVPVHSCVLSAFSPRFCSTLSSMPVPMAGQRRQIELQAVDARTLLSLVSLLYSGQLHENREQVLLAAQTLGIELPQWEEEQRHGEKVERRKESADQEIEKEADAQEWDDRMTRRMGEGSGRVEETIRESDTQTECGSETGKSGAQTNLACSEPQSIQTIYMFDPSTFPANQELGSFVDVEDTALALQAVHPGRKTITCDVLAVAPETGDSHSNDSTRKHRKRGRPRIRPLPPASRSFSTQLSSKHDTVDPSELDLLHTVTPLPAPRTEPIQPIDTLLDDIMTGLHFLPPAESQTHQHGLTTSSGPPVSKASSHFAKPTDPKQHLEGEIGDILDHFLRTFEQQVGCCGSDVGDETLQGNDKSDTSTGPFGNTSKIFTQAQPHNPHLRHEKPQENLLHTTSTLSCEPQPTVHPSVARKNNAQDGQIHRSKVRKKSRITLQQFENPRLTRSQSKKRKLETALISLQNPIKRKCNEKQTAGTRKKRQRNSQEQSVNKNRVKKLEKNNKNKAKEVCKEKNQKPTRKRRIGENRFGRTKESVDNRRPSMDGFNKGEKSHRRGRPRINSGELMKKVRRDHVETGLKADSFQANQSSIRSPMRGTCMKIASSAMEKVRMLLQLQDEEGRRPNESVGIQQGKNSGNGGLCHGENSLQGHLEEIRGAEDEGRVMVNGEFKGQESRDSGVELRQSRDGKRPRTKGKTTEVPRAFFRLNLPLKTAKKGCKDIQDKINTTESVTSVLGLSPGEPVVRLLQSEVVPRSTQRTINRMEGLSLNVGDAPQLTSAARLSHTQPCQELLSPHTSTRDSQQLAWRSVDEDEDVDVLEVSSPNSELPAVIVEVDSSTEEEEVEENVEIDVLGQEPD